MAEYLDLTHTIKEEMPVYPGTEKPKLVAANTIERDGFRETLLTMYSHTGTHTDAPAHIFSDGRTLDSFTARELCGRAVMLDVSDKGKNAVVDVDSLLPLRDSLLKSDFLVLRTGYEKIWEREEYFYGFPVLSEAACDFLLECGIRGLGVDAISIDPTGKPLYNHKKLLSRDGGFLIVENLCSLDEILKDEFELIIMPMKFQNADGAPTRVLARL